MPGDIQNVVRALGNQRPPAELTQPPFHFDETRFRRLCSPGAVPDENDLYYYVIDLNYVEIQPDPLVFLLPDCLCVWQKDLMASHTSDNAGLVEYFSGALAKRTGFRDSLSSAQYDAVAEFVRDAILDKIDQEHGLSFAGAEASPYAWIHAIGTYGTAFPAVADLWERWWSVPTTGRACGVLQYASALMYPDEVNPIFSPGTPPTGGSAPCLWATDGHVYDRAWLPENVAFLVGTLTPDYIRQSIDRASAVLRGKLTSAVPEKMTAGFDGARALVESRIGELLEYLSLPLNAIREWTAT